jgi:DNA-binding NarL/FixJ family response regulator
MSDEALELAEYRSLLTDREFEVAELVADGHSNREVAAQLFVTVSTVKKHLSQIMAKCDCQSRTQLAVQWQRAASGH